MDASNNCLNNLQEFLRIREAWVIMTRQASLFKWVKGLIFRAGILVNLICELDALEIFCADDKYGRQFIQCWGDIKYLKKLMAEW